jgi:1-acyl-sn-glycerol-3-phosphate acyltransferase
MRQRLARFVIRRMGYTMVGETPSRGILVGAPHTSNWDFVTMLLVMWHDGAHPRVLVKKELFKGPLGWVLRALGGVPLDRRDAGGVVGELAAEARDGEDFRLVIAAEGTRSRGEYWKSGFHRLSRETGLPITLAFFDPPTARPTAAEPGVAVPFAAHGPAPPPGGPTPRAGAGRSRWRA